MNSSSTLHPPPRIKWSPKLQPRKLVALYRSYHDGLVDEALLDDVGVTLYLRCESIVMIARGELYCPTCDQKISFCTDGGEFDTATCTCGYVCDRDTYHDSYRNRELWQGNAGSYFSSFLDEYPRARTVNQRMICVDTLIHAFHIDAKSQLPNRSAGNNLIEGAHDAVVELLDALSGIQPEQDARFVQTVAIMRNRRKGM